MRTFALFFPNVRKGKRTRKAAAAWHIPRVRKAYLQERSDTRRKTLQISKKPPGTGTEKRCRPSAEALRDVAGKMAAADKVNRMENDGESWNAQRPKIWPMSDFFISWKDRAKKQKEKKLAIILQAGRAYFAENIQNGIKKIISKSETY